MAEEKKVGVLGRVSRSFKNMRGELGRVVWPGRKQVVNNTGVVLIFMALSAVVIGAFDWAMSMVIRAAFGG